MRLIRSDQRNPRVRALELPLNEDIAPLSGYLWHQGIAHRIFEEHGRQVLEVDVTADAERVVDLHRRWRRGEFELVRVDRPRAPRHTAWLAAWRRYPALTVVLVAAVALFPATWPLDHDRLGWLLPWLTVVPVELDAGQLAQGMLAAALRRGEIWRLFTPMWLHFSFMHLAFNVAAMSLFGRRVEAGAGSAAFVAVVAASALTGNMAQYLWSGNALFGGLSGVAYGLFGFVVARGRRDPAAAIWQLPGTFVAMMIVFLAVMSTGVTELVGLGIANTAHWCGLASGAVLGWLLPVRAPSQR